MSRASRGAAVSAPEGSLDGPSLSVRAAERHVERLAVLGVRFGLERMRLLLAALGNPERAQPAVHVVGSNGKSSTARLAAAALRSQGLRTGTYLSPHVVGWRERIELDGRALSRERVARAVGAAAAAAASLGLEPDDQPTQFEILTAAALWTFARAGLDAAVIEAGLGGRYDATNVLGPDAVVALTNVSLEHTDLLGDTEEAIAAEKLAVCPDGSDRLVVGPLSAAATAAVGGEMARRGLAAWRCGAEVRARAAGGGVEVATPGARYPALPLGVRGRFQRDNLAVALAASERLLGRPLDPGPLAAALARVRMPGRLEVLPGSPLVVLDGAHNPAGVEALVGSLGAATGRRRPVTVVSVLGDKDAAAMIGTLAGASRAIVATRSSHPRASSPAGLALLAERTGRRAEAVESPRAAVQRAREIAGGRGAVLVCGSLYLLGDLRGWLLRTLPAASRVREAAAAAPDTLAPPPGQAR
jgi:dihydrofolate synthase / folylpolyglutamate synthase